MANLEIIIGPMFSGKSCELIKKVRLLKVLNTKYLIIKPKIDNRYIENKIVSHNLDSEDCIVLDNLIDIYTHLTPNLTPNLNSIFIDEAQFFNNLKNTVIDLVENYKINVILSGLDGDFKRQKFGEVLDLIPYCTTCIKKSALCLLCNDGTKALFSHRIIKSDEQILVGEKNEYMSVCRDHYLKLNIEK